MEKKRRKYEKGRKEERIKKGMNEIETGWTKREREGEEHRDAASWA